MQFALPVISTNWSSIPSIVVDEESGYLIPTRNPLLLAEKMESLILQPEKRERLGQYGRKLFLNKYTSECYGNNFENMFVKIAELN